MQTQGATGSQRTNMAPPLKNPEAALRPINELSFYSAMEETYGDVPQTLWEAVLKEKDKQEGTIL